MSPALPGRAMGSPPWGLGGGATTTRSSVALGLLKGDDEVNYSAIPAATRAPRIRPTKMPTRVPPRLPDLGFLA